MCIGWDGNHYHSWDHMVSKIGENATEREVRATLAKENWWWNQSQLDYMMDQISMALAVTGRKLIKA
jgi:hypothetical protein